MSKSRYLQLIYLFFLSPVAGIYLWVLGQADVSWADKPGSHKTNFEYEIYIKDCITLWGRGKIYSFKLQLFCEFKITFYKCLSVNGNFYSPICRIDICL